MKKKFSEMTKSEIDALSKEEYDAVSPFEKKHCYDCKHLVSADRFSISDLFCNNKESIKSRGTNLPGCIRCPYWKPDWSLIDKKHRTKENGYASIGTKILNFFKKYFK